MSHMPLFAPVPARDVAPFIIDLELTNACPADCVMCPRDKLPKLGLMNEEVFERLLGDLAAAPTLRYLSLCGIGEPLLHPRFFDWVPRLAALRSRPEVGLVTGGERLTPEVWESLPGLGLRRVEMSVQAVEPQLYAQLMPGLSFERVTANLEHIASHPHQRVPFSVSYTEHLENRAHTAELLRFFKERKVPVKITQLHSRAGNLQNPRLRVGPQAIPTERRCRIFEKIAFVAWDGRVHFCCHDVARRHVVGDVVSDGLAGINGRKTQMVRDGGPSAPMCAACDDPLRTAL
jgi:molybdenum cofactor biosynthesis enzyme MoaA